MTLVDIGLMKLKALNFPEPVKSLILSESNVMDSIEFLTKLGTWEMLIKISQKPEGAINHPS